MDMIFWAPEKKLGGGWICYKDTPAPPPAPDYKAAAQETAAGNLDAARVNAQANRVNQYTPYGNLTFSQDQPGTFDQSGYDNAMADYNQKLSAYNTPQQAPTGHWVQSYANGDSGPEWIQDGTPNTAAQRGSAPVAPTRDQFLTGNNPDKWSVTQTLAPAQQQLLDQQNKISLGLADISNQGLGYVKDQLNRPFDQSALPQSMVNAGQTGQDALMARFQPMIDQQHQALDSQLANQGITQGSEAYNNAQRVQNQSENDLRMQAALNGIGIGNGARQQAIQEQNFFRNEPLNMLNAVRTGSQVTSPTFANVSQQGQTAGANFMGAAQAQNQAAGDIYNAQVGSANAGNSALGSLAGTGALGAAMFFSDRRLKSNIERIGTHPRGIGIYRYEIFGRKEVGVMADEAESVMPEAVHQHESGYKMVDYDMLGRV